MAMTWAQFEARLRFLFDQLRTQIANRDWRTPPRPWSHFVEKFSIPDRHLNRIADRAILNSHIYQANYCIIIGAALLYYILRHPSSIFILLLIVIGWVQATSPTPLVFNGRRITRKERFLTASLLSLLLLLATGVLTSFLNFVGIAFNLCVIHACFRHTSTRNKAAQIPTQMADMW